jgi:hypothetical protein
MTESTYALVWDRSWALQFDQNQKYLVIRFIDEPGIISGLITWTTDSKWCHTEALSRDGQHWVGAHSGTGVNSRPLNWCKPTRERRYAIPVTDAEYETAMTWLESKIGCPYDYADIVGLFIHARIGVDNHLLICSALMTLFMQQADKWPLNCLEDEDNLVTPETLHLSPLFMNHCIYALAA